MASIKIAVINKYNGLTDADITPVVAALNIQVKQHFGPVWGIDADLTYYPAGTNPPLSAWQLLILDNSDQAGALGYHDVTKMGLPLGKVFAGTDKQNNTQWSVTASHELLEMLGDPDVNLSALVQDKSGAGTLYAYEVCDACERDEDGYRITVKGKSVLVSDFVYPSWFETFHSPGTQYDYQKKISAPLQLLPGGYISVMHLGKNDGWTQKNAEGFVPSYSARAHVGSRREKRRTPRFQWLRSTVRNPVDTKGKTTARGKTPAKKGKSATADRMVMAELAPGVSQMANVSMNFQQGEGSVTARLHRGGMTIDHGDNTNGGVITFTDVRKGDAISVDGTCTHSAIISIDVATNPGTPRSCPEGTITEGFDVL